MKKKSGIDRRGFFLIFASPSVVSAQGAYAVIAGTVFHESGHAFAGAPVELLPDSPDKKYKKQTTQTNSKGVFAFRVPAGAKEFTLSVKIERYLSEPKRVKIVGEERVEQNFLLDRATKEKR